MLPPRTNSTSQLPTRATDTDRLALAVVPQHTANCSSSSSPVCASWELNNMSAWPSFKTHHCHIVHQQTEAAHTHSNAKGSP